MLPWLPIMTNKDGDGSAIKLGVGDRELHAGAKGMPEKQALAWWISHKTTVARRWVGQQLRMGDESRVRQAIRRISAGRDRTLANLKARLERAEKANDNA
jgi:hypothetical protein